MFIKEQFQIFLSCKEKVVYNVYLYWKSDIEYKAGL